MIVHDTHKGHEVRAVGQRLAQHVARRYSDAILQCAAREPRFGQFRDRRQVDERQAERGMRRTHRGQKSAQAAADIHYGLVPAEIISFENIARDQRLRLCHQRGIGLGVLLCCGGVVGPEARQLGISPARAQQRQRVCNVPVESLVMAHHREDRRIAQQRRTGFAQRKQTVGLFSHEIQRRRCAKQAQGTFMWQTASFRDFQRTERSRANDLQQP